MNAVLVTGGSGFLGSHIVDAVLERHPQWPVTVTDLILPSIPKEKIAYEISNITDYDAIDSVVERTRPDVIIHTAGIVPALASRYSRKTRDHVFNVNVNGTQNVLAAAKKYRVKAFLWTGSCTAVTDDARYDYANIDERWPTSDNSLIYGESKAAAEAMVLESNCEDLATCALRPFVVFGPGDHQLIPSLHACISKGETPFEIGNGENLWDVVYVSNVADAHILAMDNLLSTKTAAGEAIFISNEEPVAFRDFCLAVWGSFGHHPSFDVHIPVSVATLAGYVAEWATWLTRKPTTLSRGSIFDACGTRYCSGEKARSLLGYSPKIGIEEGIQISCDDYVQKLKGLNMQDGS